MYITKPTFVVAELPETVAAWVRERRRRFEPAIAHLPAEITLAGSSGVGTIERGQSIAVVQQKLTAALTGRLPFDTRFVAIRSFPGTHVFFAAPEPEPFASRHAAVIASGVSFGSSPHAYTAHCSLKGFTPLKPGEREALESSAVPLELFTIRTIAVYEVAGRHSERLFAIDGATP